MGRKGLGVVKPARQACGVQTSMHADYLTQTYEKLNIPGQLKANFLHKILPSNSLS
jgi:hypothetical protein